MGRYYRQDFLEVNPEVKVLAHFDDGRCAIYENFYGKGRAILIGSFPSLSVALYDDKASRRAICRWMEKKGYSQIDKIESGENVLLRMHEYEEEYYITAVNYSPAVQAVKLSFVENWIIGDENDLAASTALKNGRILEFEIDGMDGKIIRLKKAD
jgi:hypothetical protein